MSDSLQPHGLCPPGSSVHGDSPGKNTGVGYHDLLQGIFPNHRSNPGLLHCRWILYCLSHKESPFTTIKAFISPIHHSSYLTILENGNRTFLLWATIQQLISYLIGGDSGKEPVCQLRRNKRCGFDPWVREDGRRHSNQLQYSYQVNPMDKGARWVRVHGVAKSLTQLKLFITQIHDLNSFP